MMDILFLLIPLSLVLVFVIGAVFWWALSRGQFDDLEGPAHRILQDNDSGGGKAPPQIDRPDAGAGTSVGAALRDSV